MKKLLLLPAIALALHSTTNAQNRVVLIEQFTNSGCPPCASATPPVYNYLNTNPADVVGVAYHASFPYNDSMHYENPTDANARINYYNVSGVPYTVIDGNYVSNYTSSVTGTLATKINARKVVAPLYEITNTQLSLVGGTLTGTIKFKSLSTSSANLVAHVVVIEKDVLKSAYAASPGNNSETHYPYVMRKMIPSANGTTLTNTAINGMDSVNFNWNLANIKNIAQLRVVAFVQNVTTKEVYEAQLFTTQSSTVGINTIINAANVVAYPNPSNGQVQLIFPTQTTINNVSVLNELGQTVYYKNVNAIQNNISLNLNVNNGIYYVRIVTSEGVLIKKINTIN